MKISKIAAIYEQMLNKFQKNRKKELIEVKKSDSIDSEIVGPEASFVLKFWITGVVIAYFSYLLFQSLNLVYLIIAAYIISIAMEAIIQFFERFKYINRIVAILLSYILLFSFFVSIFIVLVPFISSQTAEILKHLLDKIQIFQSDLKQYGLEYIIHNADYIPNYIKGVLISLLGDKQTILLIQEALQQNISQIIKYTSNYAANIGFFVVSAIGWFFSTIFQIIFVFVLAIFFSLEKKGVIDFLASISGKRNFVKRKIEKLYNKLGFRLKGQLMLSFYIGISVLIGLYLLKLFGIDLPSKFTLAIIASITEIIPIIGPILGGIPAVLVAGLNEGFWGIVAVVVMYALIQFLENNLLIPMVMNQALGISPLVIFIAMVLGGASFGFVGVVLSVPIAVIITLAFEDIIKSDGDLYFENNEKGKN